ncbi:MAG: GNAT family N-acetyltransferase [Oscillospiraceae bacterium]|nr:GNAT family N-acetyltransferase [Oscillospiraceae bacterium]
MLELQKFSERYQVRRMQDADAEEILALCMQNTQYYQYCGKQPSRELILNDLHITPPGIGPSDKYYTGFYSEAGLAAVLDLIDGYPDQNACWIGFFMMNKRLQGRQLGTEIIQHLCGYLREAGYTMLRLGIDKDNPQSTHFWKKNGFRVVREVKQDEGTILVAEKAL